VRCINHFGQQWFHMDFIDCQYGGRRYIHDFRHLSTIQINSTSVSQIGGAGGFTQNLQEVVPRADREVIARLRNCILALANCKMMLYDTSILYAYEESMKYEVYELLTQEAIFDVAFLTQHRLKLQND
jgi:hypothetical protein